MWVVCADESISLNNFILGVKKWQDYSESGDDGLKRTSRNLDEEDLLPLQENVLSTNYGLDMVVAITKVG